ncbi:metal-dependent hydrolase [Alteromonadaceae bacterium M269]|nr:metal-dependent hydrolase [Alteromonadaceae bacterium M269]
MAQVNNKHHQELEIKPRHMDFPFGSLKSMKFFDNNIYKSAFVAQLSATFPVGEAEFLNSVRNLRKEVKNEKLLKQMRGFIGQEGHHSHQHDQINKELDRLGYDTNSIHLKLKAIIDKKVKKMSHKFRLAYTVSAEHFTAIMAEHALRDEHFLDGMEAPMKDLLYWHAVEEIEHKSVAFDVYMECFGDIKFLHRVMKFLIVMLHIRMGSYTLNMAFNSPHWKSWPEFKGFMSWMFGKGGMWRSLRRPYRAFYRENFHPWESGGFDLIEVWDKQYARPEQNRANPEYVPSVAINT